MGTRALPRLLAQNLSVTIYGSISTWLLPTMLLLILHPVMGQDCPLVKIQSKVAEIERELEPRLGPVRLHRVETLEDDVFVPRLGSNSVESPFYMYEIQQRRFVLEDGGVVQHISAGSLSEYVAVFRDGVHSYGLAGFPDPEDGFKRLVSDCHLPAPRNPAEAEARALYCATVVFGLDSRQWILSEKEAEILAANHFFQMGNANPLHSAERWWRSYRRAHRTVGVGVATTQEPERDFLTRLSYFWAPVEGTTALEIRQLRILVKSDGSCHRSASPAQEAFSVNMMGGFADGSR